MPFLHYLGGPEIPMANEEVLKVLEKDGVNYCKSKDEIP